MWEATGPRDRDKDEAYPGFTSFSCVLWESSFNSNVSGVLSITTESQQIPQVYPQREGVNVLFSHKSIPAIKFHWLSMWKEPIIYFLVKNVTHFRLQQEPRHSWWKRQENFEENAEKTWRRMPSDTSRDSRTPVPELAVSHHGQQRQRLHFENVLVL